MFAFKSKFANILCLNGSLFQNSCLVNNNHILKDYAVLYLTGIYGLPNICGKIIGHMMVGYISIYAINKAGTLAD